MVIINPFEIYKKRQQEKEYSKKIQVFISSKSYIGKLTNNSDSCHIGGIFTFSKQYANKDIDIEDIYNLATDRIKDEVVKLNKADKDDIIVIIECLTFYNN